VVELSTAQREAWLVKLAGVLPAETYQRVETLLRTRQWVTGALEAKNTTLGRRRRMLFGAKTEKTRNWLAPEVVYEALIQVAAQGELLHNDDTPMRVQSLRREIAASQDPDQRTGIFTTGIVAQVGPVSGALFFTGQNHAGENLNPRLKCRAADLTKPMQMLDQRRLNPTPGWVRPSIICLSAGRP
jgi:hypothetical protein